LNSMLSITSSPSSTRGTETLRCIWYITRRWTDRQTPSHIYKYISRRLYKQCIYEISMFWKKCVINSSLKAAQMRFFRRLKEKTEEGEQYMKK
jgi:hypothetical protein